MQRTLEDEIKQVELDLVNAMMAGDADKIDQMLADDWKGIGHRGNLDTKETMLAGIRAGKNKLVSTELGPMDVAVIGDVAVIMGSNTEQSMFHGKDTTGKYVWTDMFVKRDGKWLLVRAQVTPVN